MILAPTRELASQIEATLTPLAKVMGLRTMTIFGGVRPGPQQSALRNGVDIIIATPGRLEDLIQGGYCKLDQVEVTVLDEADHMADLGFLPGVSRLLEKTPRNGQRLLFSATLDGAIDVLVKRFLTNPVVHSVDSANSPVSKMDHHVLHVDRDSRLHVIADLAAAPGRTVVFTRTKHGAKALARQLNAKGVRAVELHGNLSQNARTRALAQFSDGTASTLVATDIAARGIHVDDVGLVLHADPPVEHKAYLHRSGRTARAGAEGTVVTMMLDAQVRDVRDLTRKAGISPTITRVGAGHPLLVELAPGERQYGEPLKPAPVEQYRGRNGGGRPADVRAEAPAPPSGAGHRPEPSQAAARVAARATRRRRPGPAAVAAGAGRRRHRPPGPGRPSSGSHSAASFSSRNRGR